MIRGMIIKEPGTFTTDDTDIGDVVTHKMKIQLKGEVPVQKNYNHIPKLRNMLIIYWTEVGLLHQNPTTLHKL